MGPTLAARRLVVVAALLLGVGCTDPEQEPAVLTEGEVVALAQELVVALEAEAGPEQRAVFQEVRAYVDGYAYLPAGGTGGGSGEPTRVEPRDAAHLYQMVGAVALAQGSRQAAAWASLQAVLREPARAGYLSQAGMVLNLRGESARARAFLGRAYQLAPDDPRLELSLAVAHLGEGRRRRGFALARQAVTREAENRALAQAAANILRESVEEASVLSAETEEACLADFRAVAAVRSSQGLAAFALARSAETAALGAKLLDLGTPDLPVAFAAEFDAQGEQQADRSEAAISRFGERLEAVSDNLHSRYAALGQASAAGCASGSACSCMTAVCSADARIVAQEAFPPSYQVARSYFRESVISLLRYEVEQLEVIGRHDLTEQQREWAYQHLYGTLRLGCKEAALGFAAGFGPALTFEDLARADCEAAQIYCHAEEVSRIEQALREIEAAREAEADRLEKEAARQDPTAKFELCLDSVGCIGADGSKISVKVGGPLFAKFTFDTATYGFGARVGVGVGDPTGNVAGYDLSIGGYVDGRGSSFDVVASSSYAGGTLGKDVVLYSTSRKF